MLETIGAIRSTWQDFGGRK